MTTASTTPAEEFRSAVANAGFTIVDDVPDDLTAAQSEELAEEMLRQIRAAKV